MPEKETIRLAGVVRESIVDGPGFRFTIFCQGCPHDCPGCHNPDTHDFEGGYDCRFDTLVDAIDKDKLLDGVTFSGGEPFCQTAAVLKLAREIKKRNGLTIVIFTGYTYEELFDMARGDADVTELLSLTDLLIDGRFVQEERDLTLKFRGSRNQRIIDMDKSLNSGWPVLAEEYM